MKTDDTYNNTEKKAPTAEGSNVHKTKTPDYHMLGESGLMEDEDGNIVSPAEAYGIEEVKFPTDPNSVFNAFKKSSFVSQLDDKSNPAYWYYDYDPRYCGPDREAWAEEMALKHRKEHASFASDNPVTKVQETTTTKVQKPTTTKVQGKPTVEVQETTAAINYIPISDESKKYADEEQRAAERAGLHPKISQHVSGPCYAGIVNRNNEVVISEKDYSLIGVFNNGLAIARKRKTGKFGFIDRRGNEIIPCVWRSVGPFSEYMAAVIDDNKRCGYVDVTGRLAIPCVFEEGWPFRDGLAMVQKDRKIGMIDLQGNIVIPCRWRAMWSFVDGLAVVQDFNKRLGFIDRSGELVIPCRWKKVNYFQNGLAKVSESKTFFFKDKWVYIDKQGRIVKEE